MADNEVSSNQNFNGDHNMRLPYMIALIGAVIGVVANFIKYLTVSNIFFTWKDSIINLIIKSINDPENNLGSRGDKIIFGIVVVGVICSIIAMLFVLSRKMTKAIVFSILSVMLLFMFHGAYIHYAGAILTIIGAVWYNIKS